MTPARVLNPSNTRIPLKWTIKGLHKTQVILRSGYPRKRTTSCNHPTPATIIHETLQPAPSTGIQSTPSVPSKSMPDVRGNLFVKAAPFKCLYRLLNLVNVPKQDPQHTPENGFRIIFHAPMSLTIITCPNSTLDSCLSIRTQEHGLGALWHPTVPVLAFHPRDRNEKK